MRYLFTAMCESYFKSTLLTQIAASWLACSVIPRGFSSGILTVELSRAGCQSDMSVLLDRRAFMKCRNTRVRVRPVDLHLRLFRFPWQPPSSFKRVETKVHPIDFCFLDRRPVKRPMATERNSQAIEMNVAHSQLSCLTSN